MGGASEGGLGKRRRSHECLQQMIRSSLFRQSSQSLYRRACAGVNRVWGSHSRHRLRKSTKRGSSQFFSACDHSLLPGGPRCFPRFERPRSKRQFSSYPRLEVQKNTLYVPPCSTVVPSGSVVTVQ